MNKYSKNGSILIALIFVMMLCLTAASFFFVVGARGPLTVNQLKRTQAIYCAEAAIYETFNRIRAGEAITGTRTIIVPVCNDATAGTTYPVSVSVTISGAVAPYTVDATVDYASIIL